MNILHIDSSILGEASVSQQISAAVVRRFTDRNPAARVTRYDLAASPLDHFSAVHLAPDAATPAMQAEQELSARVVDEFLAADVVIIGAAMYNFTVPSQLKAWIDRVLRPGKTFRYSETGVVGLTGDKRIIAVVTRGGFFPPDSPLARYEHLESYLRIVFEFIGIPQIEVIAIDGLTMGDAPRAKAIEDGMAAAAALNVG